MRTIGTQVLFALTTALAAALGVGCGSDAGTTPAEASEIAFHGEASALPDFSYDTGLLPDNSPVQLDLGVSVAGGVTADAIAISSGPAASPTLSGKPGSGQYKLDVHFKLGGKLHVDVKGVPQYDGPIPGIENIDVMFGGSAAFDPFLLDGMASTTANIPETKLPPIPLPGGIPGVLQITIDGSSTLTSEFRGVCAGVTAGPEAMGTYRGETSTSGRLKLLTAIEIKIPLLGSKSFAGPDIDLPLGPTKAGLDLGTKPVPGGGDAKPGASVAKVDGCSSDATTSSTGAGGAGGTGSGGAPSTSTGSNGTGGGGVCVPVDISMYQTPYHPPSGAHQGLCTTTQIDGLSTACFASAATADTCAAYKAQNQACYDCAVTDSTTPGWGAVVFYPALAVLNIGGCVVALDSTYTVCAKAVEASADCAMEMCKNCDPADGATFDTCFYSAFPAGSTCDTLTSAGTDACAAKNGADPYATCAGNPDFLANFAVVTQAICGQ
jgi:hypothetical protein